MSLSDTKILSLEEWKDDTAEKLLALYEHTATQPMRFSLQRWQLMLRISNLMNAGIWKSAYAATKDLASLRLTRQKLTVAHNLWTKSDNRLKLAQTEPRQYQIGRPGLRVSIHS